MKRLKLYDKSITLVIDSKLKNQTKRIAYKNKMTMSAYIRYLLEISNEAFVKEELLEKLERR